MPNFSVADLLDAQKSTRKQSPVPAKSRHVDIPTSSTSPIVTAPLLPIDLFGCPTALNPYVQNLAALFGSPIAHPAAMPFAQAPPFFVGGFTPSGFFPSTGSLFHTPPGVLLQQLSGRRKRRHRTIFTDEQLAILETNFASNQYPDVGLREKLAAQCDLKEERVEVWFKNRRAKQRKSNGRDQTDVQPDSKSAGESGNESRSSSAAKDDSDCDEVGLETRESSPSPSLTPPHVIELTTKTTKKKRRLNNEDTAIDPPVKRHRSAVVNYWPTG
ncbi:Goosecoid [Aphelenchoides besseyi]|nr:Goosecoid [Aphelenchoides besseyi]